jgi:SAM-dependent methyltransferase
MFGLGDPFTYLECSDCGSLSLHDVPDLTPYYPTDYYTRRVPADDEPGASTVRRGTMALLLRNHTMAWLVTAGGGALGAHVEPWIQLLGGCGLTLDSPVLDVGCGDGHRLRTLRRYGFRHLTGVDAYLASEQTAGGITLSRAGLDSLAGPFDLVMFHHSFEHMADPAGVLAQVHRLLAPSGRLLLRIPLAGSWAWRTYGVHWVQLDAPRHLFLFTPRGLDLLAGRAGFVHRGTVYDSGPFQFWGSELYRHGTALQDSGSVDGNPPPTVSHNELARWERQAKRLNRECDGDQGAFLFAKQPEAGSG